MFNATLQCVSSWHRTPDDRSSPLGTSFIQAFIYREVFMTSPACTGSAYVISDGSIPATCCVDCDFEYCTLSTSVGIQGNQSRDTPEQISSTARKIHEGETSIRCAVAHCQCMCEGGRDDDDAVCCAAAAAAASLSRSMATRAASAC